jgi:hypothetical protein
MSSRRKFYGRPYIKDVKDQIRMQFSNIVKFANSINVISPSTELDLTTLVVIGTDSTDIVRLTSIILQKKNS